MFGGDDIMGVSLLRVPLAHTHPFPIHTFQAAHAAAAAAAAAFSGFGQAGFGGGGNFGASGTFPGQDTAAYESAQQVSGCGDGVEVYNVNACCERHEVEYANSCPTYTVHLPMEPPVLYSRLSVLSPSSCVRASSLNFDVSMCPTALMC